MIWDMEEKNLYERHQLLKQQLKDQYFLQRHQLLKKHEKVNQWIAAPAECTLINHSTETLTGEVQDIDQHHCRSSLFHQMARERDQRWMLFTPPVSGSSQE